MKVLVRLPTNNSDGRVTLKVLVSTGVAESLYDEASHRRVSASSIAERLFREGLPELAEERVRDHMHRGALSVITDETSMPSALAEGISDSILAQDPVDQILPGDGDEPTPGGHADPP